MKRFRTCSLDQPFLLPPALQDWLPEGHLARFIADVADTLDLSAIYRVYERHDGRGLAAYHPLMLTRLLLYAYATGRPSSRRIERATYDDLAFRYLAADQHPDHDTIAAFRQQHLEALAKLFAQALRLCQRAGLVKLGTVVIDGTKVRANASPAHSMRYKDLDQQEQRLRALVDELLVEAERVDAEEDARFGPGRRGDELPPQLADAQQRLEKLRQAKRELEQEAQQKLAEAERQHPMRKSGRRRKDHEPPPESPAQREKTKRRFFRARREAQSPTRHYNFTDPDSRMVYDNGIKTVVQGYNAQLAVDGHAQIVVAAEITQEVNDKQQLLPMAAAANAALGQAPQVLLADAGYWDTTSLLDPALTPMTVLVSPDGRGGTGGSRLRADHPLAARMREAIGSVAGRALYRTRKSIVEPVIGHIKQQRGFRQFALRGLQKVQAEWKLICLTHNLLKLYRLSLAT
ncbi:MAG: IS1182 family transposase [Bryobacteraceae bacterium]|jgi:transposase